MSALDKAKERLSYFKFWLGVMIATFISVGGWLINNIQSDKYFLISLGIIIEVVMIVVVYYLNRFINKMIDDLEEL